MAEPKIITDAVEYIKYEELNLPDANTVQKDFWYWKSIEKLDPNIHIKPWLWWGIWWWHIIQDEWVILAQRANIDFIWDAVIATDNEEDDKTIVTINHQDLSWLEPKFTKNSAFNKDFWTSSWTVAEWNHTHTSNYWRDGNGYFRLPVWSNMYT